MAWKQKRGLIWLLIGGAVVLALLARPVIHVIRTALEDDSRLVRPPEGYVEDASRLNQTQVAEVWRTPIDVEGAEQQLAALLERARRERLKVSIAGARHSMGGHTIYPGGLAIDMLPLNHMRLDEERNILHVGAGALWQDIIPYLDAHLRSVAVMQSNNSFSVGGSISVNCHGWQFARPPIASTVESFRLMKADGAIVRCSRDENQELFSLVLGGYGLFGIILDVELRVVLNERYRLEQYLVPVQESLATFDQRIKDEPGTRMVYARMSITSDHMFEEVIINAFIRDNGEIPPLSDPAHASLRRAIFRGSVGSEYGKELRWGAETKLQPLLAGKAFSRNQLLNEGVEVFQNRSAESTDILHEYFVPRDRAVVFVDRMRRIIRQHRGDLLNVTVRGVDEDTDTFLRYADRQMLAFVMLFNQPRTRRGESSMQQMTRHLIDAAILSSGRYYLPYRLHATTEQFRRCYPQADEFFELKRKYDPDELFQNEFYRKYGDHQ